MGAHASLVIHPLTLGAILHHDAFVAESTDGGAFLGVNVHPDMSARRGGGQFKDAASGACFHQYPIVMEATRYEGISVSPRLALPLYSNMTTVIRTACAQQQKCRAGGMKGGGRVHLEGLRNGRDLLLRLGRLFQQL